MLVCNNLKTKIGGTLLQFPKLVIGKNVITETKQIWKGTSFHIQNFDCYENVLAKRGKKLQGNFLYAITT